MTAFLRSAEDKDALRIFASGEGDEVLRVFFISGEDEDVFFESGEGMRALLGSADSSVASFCSALLLALTCLCALSAELSSSEEATFLSLCDNFLSFSLKSLDFLVALRRASSRWPSLSLSVSPVGAKGPHTLKVTHILSLGWHTHLIQGPVSLYET